MSDFLTIYAHKYFRQRRGFKRIISKTQRNYRGIIPLNLLPKALFLADNLAG